MQSSSDPASVRASIELPRYHAGGYLVIKGLFDAEDIHDLSSDASRLQDGRLLTSATNLRCRWQANAGGEPVFDAFDPVVDISAACKRIAHDERILNILRIIYEDEPQLFRDKLIYKAPGTVGYPLHQDFISGTVFPISMISVIVPIDKATAESGCVEVFPGCHVAGYLTEDCGNHCLVPLEKVKHVQPVPLLLEPGDVAVFSCFTPHRSGSNVTNKTRRQLYLSYNRRADGGDRRLEHYRQLHKWLESTHARLRNEKTFFL